MLRKDVNLCENHNVQTEIGICSGDVIQEILKITGLD